MKLIRLGIIIPLFLLLVWGVGAQTYEPEVDCKDALPAVSSYQTLAIGNASTSINSSEIELKLNYLNQTGFPNYATSSDYKPLETFWEFTYPNQGNKKEYCFLDTARMVFPQTPFGVDATVHVKLWTIDDYDKDEPPALSYSDYDVVYTNATSSTKEIDVSSLKILASWDPSPGDSVIYILRLEIDCDSLIQGNLQFLYDISLVDVIETNSYLGATSPGRVNWNVSGSDFFIGATSNDRYRDYYVKLKMKDNAPLGVPFECSAKYVPDTRKPDFCAGGTLDDLRSDTIDISHDPNKKFVAPEILCMDMVEDKVVLEYKIDFQNTGPGGAHLVTIEDWLDKKEYVESIEYLGCKPNGVLDSFSFNNASNATVAHPINFHPTPGDGHALWRFKYDGTGLRGTEEQMHQIDFMTEDTKSWLKFRVTYDKAVLDSCNALMNHARITFDCNPEFYTKTIFANMSCVGAIGEPCPECAVLEDTILKTPDLSEANPTSGGVWGGGIGDNEGRVFHYTLPSTLLQRIGSSLGPSPNINWYPDRWLDDNNSLNAVMAPLEDITYTLVASSTDDCTRMIYRIIIDVNDFTRSDKLPMHILDDSSPGDCQTTPIIIGGSPGFNYKWENGSTSPSFSINSGTQFCRVTVTDAHGCTEVFGANLRCNRVRPWVWGVIGIAVIGILWFIIGKRKIIGGG